MGVDFSGFYIRMAHQFLYDPDVDANFEQVGGVAGAKRVTGDPLGQSGAAHCRAHGLLQSGGEHMVAALTAVSQVDAALSSG